MNEKLTKLLENRDFVEKILNMETDEEVKNEFKSNGVDLTDEEILEIKKAYGQVAEKLEKLDDGTLEKLSGGWGETEFEKLRKSILKSAANKSDEVVSVIISGCRSIVGLFGAKVEETKASTRKQQVISDSLIMLDVVALSAVAGLIYSNRRAIKRWWNSSSNVQPETKK